MYAIIKTGGKQYTVKPGDVLQIEKLDKDLGAEFDINEVLFVGGETAFVGTPVVANAAVTVVVTKQAKTRKVIVFKKKRRHSYRKFATHRQNFTEIFIKAIKAPNGKSAKSDEQAHVVDVNQARKDRIVEKMETRKARVSARGDEAVEAAKPAKKATVKKTVKKVAKKASPKKTAKSAAKKTTKKAAK